MSLATLIEGLLLCVVLKSLTNWEYSMILAELCKRHHHVPVIANDIDIDTVLRRLATG